MPEKENLNQQLYEKMSADQDKYRDWLTSQPPEEILNHAYEYTVREDILMALEYMDLPADKAQALLSSNAPLDEIYNDFAQIEGDHMDIIRGCIETRANDILENMPRDEVALQTAIGFVEAHKVDEGIDYTIYDVKYTSVDGGVIEDTSLSALEAAMQVCEENNLANPREIDHGEFISKDETYIGNSVHGKQSNVSYKNKKSIRRPESEWFRAENTHEAIISKDVFNQVQKQIVSRRRPMKSGKTQIFAGLVKCADCGWSLSYCNHKSKSRSTGYFNCSKFRQLGKAGGQCTAHYVRYDTLYAYVLARLQDWIYQAHTDEKELLNRLLKTSDKEAAKAYKKQSAEPAKAEKRKTEVDRLFVKLYEDWSSGRITEYNFKMLSQKYQAEQQELVEKIEKLKSELATEKQTTADAEKWIALIKQYANPTELTAEMLNTLIEKIVVHEATKGSDGIRTQEIEIFYRFVGKID